jgi:alcohol dehydrogenase (cytochrome c)
LSGGNDSTWAFQNQNQQNTGYSSQTLINASNVGDLQTVWSTPLGGIYGTPVVWDGMVFVVGNDSFYAVSESTGNLIWQDGPSNTGFTFSTAVGVTIANGDIFGETFSSQLVSINALTGAINWNVSILVGLKSGVLNTYAGPDATPLVFNNKVIVGDDSGDYVGDSRGFVRAFNEKNGKLDWTFYTVPAAPINATSQKGYEIKGVDTWGTNGTYGCTCGGGAVWNVPSVDPHTGIIYFGTGDPYPNVRGYETRAPNSTTTNLYTDCIIALNSSNGKMVWYFQAYPHDWGDHDEGMPTQLFNTTINGVETEVLGSGGKSGYYFELNALTGAEIYKIPVGMHVNSNLTESDPTTIAVNMQAYPGADGGINTFSSYDPVTNMIYTVAWNSWQICNGNLSADTMRCTPQTLHNSTLAAIDASTGQIVWGMNMTGYAGGVSSTNDIVFAQDGNHTFYALNGYTGQILYQRYDPSGDGILWSWGSPSITNGMVFQVTSGVSPPGNLEALAIPYTSPENATFTETGLPTGQQWNVTFDGMTYSSNTTTITVSNVSSAIHFWSVGSIPVATGTRLESYPNNGSIPSQSDQFSFSIAFNNQYLVSIGLKPGKSGTVSPSSGSYWFNASSIVTISATPNQGFTFSRWASSTKEIAIANKTATTTTATINGPGKITAIFG